MPNGHSLFSASAADRWMQCPGSLVLSADAERSTSEYAAEGTVAHDVLTHCLQHGVRAEQLLGAKLKADGYEFTVDPEMVDAVQVCLDYVDALKGDDGTVLVDQRVNYSHYLDVPEDQAWGTADVIVLRGNEVTALDYKHGKGVLVDARDNRQCKLYGLGVVRLIEEVLGEKPERIRLAISQPRVTDKPSEHDLSVAELELWGYGEARSAACSVLNAQSEPPINAGQAEDWNGLFLRPGEKQCKFCPAKATCPALREEVIGTVTAGGRAADPEEFDDALNFVPRPEAQDHIWISRCLDKVDMIEDWCKAVRAEAERRLLAGEPVPGYKVVAGKKGARAWSDPAEAEKTLREKFRLTIEQAYDLKLISPTSAEKLAKAGVIGPRQWGTIQALIVQQQGRPHVAPISDPRPAIDVTPTAAEFDVVSDLA